jgi:acyl carrier protein
MESKTDNLRAEHSWPFLLASQTERHPKMNEQEFIANMEDLLETDPGSISLATQLDTLAQWDSLAFVSFLAMADSKYGVRVTPTELRQSKSIADLMKLVEKK